MVFGSHDSSESPQRCLLSIVAFSAKYGFLFEGMVMGDIRMVDRNLLSVARVRCVLLIRIVSLDGSVSLEISEGFY